MATAMKRPKSPSETTTDGAAKPVEPDRVQLTKRNAFWEVEVDGAFHSDYRRKEEALIAVALIKLSL